MTTFSDAICPSCGLAIRLPLWTQKRSGTSTVKYLSHSEGCGVGYDGHFTDGKLVAVTAATAT